MKILFNADDFGLTKGVTDGIIQAHTNGILTSTTLMMNGNAVAYAVEEAKKYPSLNIGVHLVLTYGKPLCHDVPDLINEQGSFKYSSSYLTMAAPDPAQVRKEWKAQIEAFLKTGLSLHHLDSHHHVHGWEPLKEIIIELSKEYNVPVRYMDTLKHEQEILLTEMLYDGFYGDGVNEDIFKKLKQMDFGSIEVMTHPAIVDESLRQVSSYQDKREKELEILCSLAVPEWAKIID